MVTKVQASILISEEERDRCDALRVALSISRAEVQRLALAEGLRMMENRSVLQLGRLYTLADATVSDRKAGMRPKWIALVRDYVDRYRQGGPALTELEEMSAAKLRAAARQSAPDAVQQRDRDPIPSLPE